MKLTTKLTAKIRLTILTLSILAMFSKTGFALTTEQEVTPVYVRDHPKEFSVEVTKGKNGLINFTIRHHVATPMYHVAHLAIYHRGKLVATSDTPTYGKKQENTFHFFLSPEDINESKFDLSDSALIGSGENAVAVPGTTTHQFRLFDFVPKEMLKAVPNK